MQTSNNYPMSEFNSLNKDCLRYICQYLKNNIQNSKQKQSSKQKLKQIVLKISKHIPTLYQTIKILHFIFKYQVPFCVALKALSITNCLFQTCQIFAINLIQVYILPFVYLSAINYAQNSFNKNKNKFNSTHQQLIFQYESNCFDTIIVWSIIKPKILFQTQQMMTNSYIFDCMIKVASTALKICQLQISFTKIQQILERLYQNSDFIFQKTLKLKQIFKQKQKMNFNHLKSGQTKQYTNFFIKLFKKEIFQELKSQSKLQTKQNINYKNILDAKRFPIQNLPQLKIYQLFQTLDPILTFPLNQQIFNILQKQQFDFAVMKVCIRIISKMIKWGDLQTYFNVVYSEEIQKMAINLLQINGQISFEEGQYYLPEITHETNRVPFYIEFLRFIQVFANCKIPDFDSQLKHIKLRKIYKQLKIRRFLFPENLMIAKIQKQFSHNLTLNAERNQILFKKIDQIKVKQSLQMRISMSLQLLASHKNSKKFKKNVIIMKSANVLEALRKQFKQIIVSLQNDYQNIIKRTKQIRNIINNQQKLIQLHNLRRKMQNLKQEIKILQQQLDANQKQTEETIRKYLAGITKKGKDAIQRIIPQLNKLQIQNEKQIKQQKQSKLQIKTDAEIENIKGIQKMDKIAKLKKSFDKQQQIDELSSLMLSSSFQSKQSQIKQDSKVMIKNVDNIISITSQYGWFQSGQPEAQQLQLKCIPQSSIKCNTFSMNSNCISPKLIQNSKGQKISSFLPSLYMDTNDKKNSKKQNQNQYNQPNQRQLSANTVKKDIQSFIQKVNINNVQEAETIKYKNKQNNFYNELQKQVRISSQKLEFQGTPKTDIAKENVNLNTVIDKRKQEPKTPSTFRQILQIQNQLIRQTQFASDYLSARSNSRDHSRLKNKSKCISNLPLKCIYSNSNIGTTKIKSQTNLLKTKANQINSKFHVKKLDNYKAMENMSEYKDKQNQLAQNSKQVIQLYYNNKYDIIPYQINKDKLPKKLGITNQHMRTRTLQNYRKRNKGIQIC